MKKRRDRSNIADEVVRKLFIDGRVDRQPDTDQKQGVTVRRRSHDLKRADIAAAARPVLNDERLSKPLREQLSEQSRVDIVRAAGRKGNNDAHRPRRIGLRASETGDGRQCGGRCSQMQEGAAGKFHFEPPFTSLDPRSDTVELFGGVSWPRAATTLLAVTASNMVKPNSATCRRSAM